MLKERHTFIEFNVDIDVGLLSAISDYLIVLI